MCAYLISNVQKNKYVADRFWLGLTLAAVVDSWAEKSPAKIAICHNSVMISYRELVEKSNSFAAALQSFGVSKGDVVSVQLPNIPEFIIAALAVSKLGAIFNTIPMPFRSREIDYILGFSETKALIYTSQYNNFDYEDMFDKLRSSLPALKQIVVGQSKLKDSISFSGLVKNNAGAQIANCPVPEDLFNLYYTSGTTGVPKGVLHTYQSALSNAYITGNLLGVDENEIVLSLSPFSFSYGTFSMYISLIHGAKQVLLESFNVSKVFSLLEAEGITFIFGVPAAGVALLAGEEIKNYCSGKLKKFLFSGSPLTIEVARGISKMLGCQVLQQWGMTEIYRGAVTTLDDSFDLVCKSSGLCEPGWEVVVLDDNYCSLPTGNEGEVAIKGPFLFDGYYKNPEANAESFTEEGWFLTKDLGIIDEKGYLKITGRKKDVINRGGVKFSPKEVEDVLGEFPKIVQAALVGMPDRKFGERSCLFVVLTPGKDINMEELHNYLEKKGVAKFKFPERIEVIEKLPLSATGKVQKNILREIIANKLEKEAPKTGNNG